MKDTIDLYDSREPEKAQHRALTGGEIPVAVYGLGKMGLPLATVLADATENVIGVDIDTEVIEAIARGDCPVSGEPGLADEMQTAIETERLDVTDDPAAAASEARVHVVVVPTVLDGENEPELSALRSALGEIATGLSPGDMVVVESTVPPGTCRDLVQPALVGATNLPPDSFGLAFCPERTASGRALEDIRGAYPKVVGGRDTESTRVARLLYEEVTTSDVVDVSDCTTAECVKLFEGVYRDVNIALANELAQVASEFAVDVNEAIDVANDPEYCQIHSPGPGVGGHCIPYYPYFVTARSDRAMPLVGTARKVNEKMPAHTVELLNDGLDRRGVPLADATVALLGVTYRAGVDETRAAPAFPMASILKDAGATVYAVDPVCSDMSGLDASPVTIDLLPALDLDAVILVTAHEEFEGVDWEQLDNVFVLDGRQALDDTAIPQPVQTLGDGTTDSNERAKPMQTND